jgi:very-short-patch-repair endonuclease
VKQSEAAHPEFDRAWTPITADLFDPARAVSTSLILNDTPLPDLGKWATARAADVDRLDEWARFVQVAKDATAFGIAGILDEVRAGEFTAAAAANAFQARFYRMWLDALHQKVPILATFATDTHERLLARFAQLDRLSIRSTPGRVRGRLLTNSTRPRTRDGAPDASELGILLREVNKKRRHLPLRHLFRQIPAILPRIKPCLMMSPLAVSTYLDTPELSFDIVIFDEASQVRPHDAVCAIYRSKQLVVGGDPKQLPPTDFFTRTGEDVDEAPTEESGTGSFESLLDVCLSLGLTRKRLRWHYRSRREGLIAFSNRFFYDGKLVTFPSADEATGPSVQFVKVVDGHFKDGVNPVEARRVASLVMEHARTTPDRSLGVIAFSQRQQDRILAELETLRRAQTDTEPFFADDRADPFFVKNLENVQGDERDAIFLSVGYGPDDTGKVAMRFGPLNRDGGERRLNVAVTRARWAMTVVASMTASDVDLSRTAAEGAKMLKAFLDYAERGPKALAEAVTDANQRDADSPFEQEVGDELTRRGLVIQRQVGCGGYLIDIAITDPQKGGKYLLGVECDGATYHSAATARDRDRLRQAVLEGLGWRLVRVWSSDWVRDRDKQVQRILAALEAAKKPKPDAKPDTDIEKLPVVNWRPPKTTKQEFDSIEVVPDAAIVEAITATLTEFGSMPAEDLIAAVSKRLGFKRTGPKIHDRIANSINDRLSARGLSVSDDGRIRLVSTP